MATPESKVKAKVKKVLEQLGAYYAMPIGTGFGNAGVPDFLVCYQGRFIGIECKAGGNTPTKLQEYNMVRIWKSGGVAIVVNEDNVDNLSQSIRNFANE